MAERDAVTVRAESLAEDEFPGTSADLLEEIERLSEENREERDDERERRLLTLRHVAGVRLERAARADPAHVAPGEPPPKAEGLPDVAPEELTPELLRAGILRDGAVLVRGLVSRDHALAFAEAIDRCFADRDHAASEGERLEILNGARSEGVYHELGLLEGYKQPLRAWVQMGGGVLAGDSPGLAFDMLELFREAGLPELVSGYLGEPALLALQKTTLRKADPSVPGAWHQDGYFLGPVRALNLWLSLSRCGEDAPGLDVVPRRLDELAVTGTEGARLDYEVSPQVAEEVAGERRIIRPFFEPGDALLFDDLFLHQTASDPAMPNPRFAIESWFFGASGFPGEYAPLAV